MKRPDAKQDKLHQELGYNLSEQNCASLVNIGTGRGASDKEEALCC